MSHSPHILFLKSSLTCSIAIIPAVVLAYFSCTSVGFQDWVLDSLDWIGALMLRSSELPSWIHFALAGAVYWAQCVIAKTIVHPACKRFVYGLIYLQIGTLVALMAMSPGVLKAAGDSQAIGLAYIVHFCITILFAAKNAERCSAND